MFKKKKDYCLQLKIYIKIQPRYYYFTGVYITNKKLRDLLEIRNFSFCVQKPSFRISARPCNIVYMYIYLLCSIGKHSWLSALLQIWNCAMIYGLCRSTLLTALFSRPSLGRIVRGSNSKEIAFQNGILFPGTCIAMYFFRHLTALSWAIWKELRQLDLFKNWMAYPVCSFQANSVQNLHSKIEFDYTDRACVYFSSIVCTCRTLGAIKEKKIIVWYFSFFTVILFFFFIKD